MSMKKSFKSLLVCGASLMLIASLAPANNGISSASRVHRSHISRRAHKSYYSVGKRAFNQAKKAFRSSKKSLRWCMIDGLNNYPQSKHASFINGYLSAYNHFNGYKSKFNKRLTAKLITCYALHHNNTNYRKGFTDSLSQKIDNIPKRYQRNVSYGLGYMESSMNDYESGNHDFAIEYDMYLDSQGHVPAKSLLSHKNYLAYHAGVRTVDHEYRYAMTKMDHDARYEQNAFKKLHLNKRYYALYKDALGAGPSYDNISDNFGSGLVHKFAYHRYVYFPKDVVSGESGYLHGLAVGHYNNSATRKTARNFIKYIMNNYRNYPSKRYNHYFRKNYSNKRISYGSGMGDSGFSSDDRYEIYSHHQKRSTIYYNMPTGPEDYVPKT